MIRLEDELVGSLVLSRENGYMVTYDLGVPAPIANVEQRTNADGELDETQWHGPRNVGLTVMLNGSDAAQVAAGCTTRKCCAELRDDLMRFLHPQARPVLVIEEPNDSRGLRRLVLSPRGGGVPMVHPRYNAMQINWSAPDGVIEAYTPTVVQLRPGGGVEPGREYPLSFPRDYPSAAPRNVVRVNNLGTMDAHWKAVIVGQIDNPRIILSRVGHDDLEVALTADGGVTLGPLSIVTVDTRSRRVLFDDDPANSALRHYDFAGSTMFRIPRGESFLRLDGDNLDANAVATVTFRSTWL